MNKIVKINTCENDEFSFISTFSLDLLNSLRRIAISEVPTIAIEKLQIRKNESNANDLFLSHRLAQIPIQSSGCNTIEGFNYPSDCVCESSICNKCAVIFTLSLTNKTNRLIDVSSSHLKSNSKNHTPMSGVKITTLGSGKSIEFMCYGRKGIGKMHAKWQPTTICTVTSIAKITPKQNCDPEKLVEVCPRKVFKMDPKTGFGLPDIEECDFCMRCQEYAEVEDGDFHVFTLEACGQLKARELFLLAVRVLKNKSKEIKGGVDKLIIL